MVSPKKPALNMAPRRKSKKATAPDADPEAETASQGTDPHSPPPTAGPSSSRLSIGSLPADVDFNVLSTILPNVSFETPSSDAILNCYRLILAQHEQLDSSSRDLEDLRAEAERKDVELDQALQDRESAVRELETSVDSVQNELNVVKRERDELGEISGLIYLHSILTVSL